jgi:hypothetical protein
MPDIRESYLSNTESGRMIFLLVKFSFAQTQLCDFKPKDVPKKLKTVCTPQRVLGVIRVWGFLICSHFSR